MSRGEARGLILVGVKLEAEDHELLQQYAEANGVALCAAGRMLIAAALRGENGAGPEVQTYLKSRGHQEALRQAAHKIHSTITDVFKEDL